MTIRQQMAWALEAWIAQNFFSWNIQLAHQNATSEGLWICCVCCKCVLEIVCFLQSWNLFRIQLQYNCEVCSCAVFHSAILNCISSNLCCNKTWNIYQDCTLGYCILVEKVCSVEGFPFFENFWKTLLCKRSKGLLLK